MVSLNKNFSSTFIFRNFPFLGGILFLSFWVVLFSHNSFLFSRVFIHWRVISLSRIQFSSTALTVLSISIGIIIFGSSFGWMIYLLYFIYLPFNHIVIVTFLPPMLCGFYVGLFFRQHAAKIVSIVFTILLSLFYPIFNIIIHASGQPANITLATIYCTFAGNLLFVGIIRLVNHLFFRSAVKTDEKDVFTQSWYRFKEGKFFFATWTHFSILRLLPLIAFIFWEEWYAFFNILGVYVLSIGFSVFYYFYWQKTRKEFISSLSAKEDTIKP